jgi:hypothetical protein
MASRVEVLTAAVDILVVVMETAGNGFSIIS